MPPLRRLVRRIRLATIFIPAAVVTLALTLAGSGTGASITLNVVQLDTGYCGQSLQDGPDHNASKSATPSFILGGDGGFSAYTIYIDGALLGTFNSDGFANVCIRTTVPLSQGAHQLTGNELTPHPTNVVTPLDFTVDTVPPGQTSQPVLPNWSDTGIIGDNIVASRTFTLTGTSDMTGVKMVQILRAGQFMIGGAIPSAGAWQVACSVSLDGTYSLQGAALDGAGNQSPLSTPLTLTVDTTAPTTALTNPTANSVVTGIVPVTASASDGVGVWKVDFKVDNVLKSTDTSAPYSYTWDSGTVANGQHTLTEVTTDLAGNTATSSATVSVLNGGSATAPGAPGSLTATAGAGNVGLSWTAAAANGSAVTNYLVYRGTASGGETLLTTLGNVTSWTDPSVTNGATYFYQVTARNGIGEGPRSNEASAIPAALPGAPSSLAATAGDGNVALTWSPAAANGSAVTNYFVYRGTASGGETLLTTLGNVTSWTDMTAQNGTTYYYQVSAKNAINEGPRSSEASATPIGRPDMPGSFAATAGDGFVSLSWSPAAPNGSAVTNYLVYRSTASGSETLLTTLGNVSSWSDLSVANGTTYYYQVTAKNAAGEGTRTGERSALPSGRPGAPGSLSATAGTGNVSLSWSPAAPNGSGVTTYYVYRGTASGGETLLTTLGNVTSWMDTSATSGTYYYQVSAANANGEGLRSVERSATVSAAATVPGAPSSLAATAGDGSVSLVWGAPGSDGGSAVTNYLVYRGTASGGETLLTTLGNVTSWTDTTAANGTTYYYQVSAKNSVGEGSRSVERSASPSSTGKPGVPGSFAATGYDGFVILSWTAAPPNGSSVTNYYVYRSTVSGGETLLGTLSNVTAWADTTITNGTTYYYQVSAKNALGEGPRTIELSATPGGAPAASAPGAPGSLTATAGDGTVGLSWAAAAPNGAAVTNYLVYRGTASGGETLLTTLGNVTSWTDTTAVNGTTYYYQVSAKNSVGEGPRAAERSALPAGRPGTSSLLATGGDGNVSLSWSPAAPNGSGVTNYLVYRGTASGGETLLATLGNVTSWTDTGVSNGTPYYYQVSAKNAIGEGSRSSEQPATPSASAGAPGAPGSLTATAGDGTVGLSWTAAAPNGSAVTNYLVYRGTASGGETLLTTLANVTSWTDTTAVNGTTYYYQVSARNSISEGARSSERSAMPSGKPGVPGSFSVTGGNGFVSLSWSPATPNGSAVTNYYVYRGTASGGETLLTTLGSVTSWTDTGVANGATYYYQVSAGNGNGVGARSSEQSATVSATPGAPGSFSVSGGDGFLSLSWSPAAPNGSAVTNYLVYRGTASGGETLLTTLGNVTSWTDTGVANGTTYYYQVSASNVNGVGSRSAEQSMMPSGKPGPPTLWSANGGAGGVALAWNPPASDGGSQITNYRVYRGTASGGEELIATIGNQTTYTDTSAVVNVTYWYQVAAVNTSGDGSRSGELSASVPTDTTPPGTPTNLKLAIAGTSQLAIYWTASTGDVTAYDVYRNGVLIATSTVPNFLDGGRAANTTYTYTVKARDAAGNPSAFSTALSARTASVSGTTATLGGVVYSNGKPVANVTVQLNGNGVSNKTAKTNNTGVYKFSNLKAGSYTLTVSGTVFGASALAGQTVIFATNI